MREVVVVVVVTQTLDKTDKDTVNAVGTQRYTDGIRVRPGCHMLVAMPH